MILSVDATIPGSQNDQFVYDQSQLKLVSELGFLRDYVIIADSGYVLKLHLLLPSEIILLKPELCAFLNISYSQIY